MSVINVDTLSYRYETGKTVLSGVTFAVNRGERWAVIGKNGCGKSTMLKCIGNLLVPAGGTVLIEGRPVSSYRPQDLAKIVAYVPQAIGRTLPPCPVADFVMLGRFPYQNFFALPTTEDRKAVHDALLLTDTAALADRTMTTLSGGELQRVFLAGAVAQKSTILILDEPMSFLDPLHQTMVQRALDRIHDEFGTTIITVTHDVNLALNRYTHICALSQNGGLFFEGTATDFRKKSLELLRDIYSISFIKIGGCSNCSGEYYVPEGVWAS